MEIKIATLDAIPQIEVLYQELFLEMSILQPKYIRPTKQDVNFIRFTIIEDDSDILIAEKDQEIVGFLLLKEMTTLVIHAWLNTNTLLLLMSLLESDIKVKESERPYC